MLGHSCHSVTQPASSFLLTQRVDRGNGEVSPLKTLTRIACVIVPLDAGSGQREWGGISVKNVDTHSLRHHAS